jgi:hypothetical protein
VEPFKKVRIREITARVKLTTPRGVSGQLIFVELILWLLLGQFTLGSSDKLLLLGLERHNLDKRM